MNQDLSDNNVKSMPAKHGFFFHFLKWILIILIIFFSLKLITKPAFSGWSDDYLKRGDAYLQEKKYLSAKLSYDKALLLNKNNSKAIQHREVSISAPNNIFVLESFYREKNNSLEYGMFDELKNLPVKEIDATQKSKELIENGQFQLAIEAAKISIKINQNYTDGWLYLGIAYFKAYNNLEVSKVQKDTYLDEARKAFLRVNVLDPNNNTASSYLQEITRI